MGRPLLPHYTQFATHFTLLFRHKNQSSPAMLITKFLCQPAAVELLVADFCRYGAYPALWSVFGDNARSLWTGYQPAEGMLAVAGACVRLWVV